VLTGGSHYPLDLLHVEELGGQASVHAQDLLVHDRSHGQAVKAVSEGLPQLDIVSPLACKNDSENIGV
jgi:hypothetical protein